MCFSAVRLHSCYRDSLVFQFCRSSRINHLVCDDHLNLPPEIERDNAVFDELFTFSQDNYLLRLSGHIAHRLRAHLVAVCKSGAERITVGTDKELIDAEIFRALAHHRADHDLRVLLMEKKGIIEREHGFAVLRSMDDLNGRIAYHYESKKKIANKASALVTLRRNFKRKP